MDIEEALGEVEPKVETTTVVETKEATDTGEEEVKAEEVKADSDKDESPPGSEEMMPKSAFTGLRRDFQEQVADLKAEVKSLKTAPEPESIPSVFDNEQEHDAAIEARGEQRSAAGLMDAGKATVRRYEKDGEHVDEALEWAEATVKRSPSFGDNFQGIGHFEVPHLALELWLEDQARQKQDDPVTDRALIKEQVRLELKAEAEKKAAEKEKLRDSIPETLVGDSSKGNLSGSDWSGPATIESIVDTQTT